MGKSFSDIYQIFKPDKFQKVQDDISIASELAIITVDYKGVPITSHSNCSEFCKKMRSSKFGVYCEKCDSHGGLEAARIGKPFIYICHAGLIDFAIPIIVDGLYLGALMAGQVLAEPDNSEIMPERILQGVSNTIDLSSDLELQQSYALLPVMRLEKITALANMLSHVGDYCIEQATLREAYAQFSKNSSSELFRSPILENTSAVESEKAEKVPNKLLQPALTYINKHPNEKITLSKVATLCSISTSYFSKLFAKENLGSLSDYVNHIKMDRAKELLISSDWSVGTIAENLSFDDCGYFIKVFKHETGKTPLEYRIIHNSGGAEKPN